MIPDLSTITKTPQARIASAIVGLLLWLAPAGAVWLYMHGKASAQFDLGKAEDMKATN